MTCAITYLVSRLEWGLKGGAIHDNAVMARYARMCNEAGAELVSAYPGRFGLFAVLPLPFDIEGSLAEIAYAFDTLKAKGIALCTSYGDTWLGDPIFAPIFEELNRRKAVVFVHPTVPTCCVSLVPRINYTVVEYGADTTRTIMSLIVSGASQKYTDCRFIFTHGGGVMPFLIERVLGTRRSGETETMAQIFGPSQQPGSPMYELRRFHYDTAAVYNPASMSALVQVVGIPRIVFGTDYPYGDMPVIAKYMHQCNLSAPDLQAIGRTNALAFLPA
jgi:predicted TIM-barrel fold metal-dependent hydrolase